jgi:hypothetical protein
MYGIADFHPNCNDAYDGCCINRHSARLAAAVAGCAFFWRRAEYAWCCCMA